MKKISFLIFYTLIVNNLFCQGIVRKIEFYVIPLSCSFRTSVDYSKVKRLSTIHIIIKEANYQIDNDEFLELIKRVNETKETEISSDFRIKCVIKKIIGKEVLYFNKFLDFQYKGKTYRDENIKKFILNHIPESCKL